MQRVLFYFKKKYTPRLWVCSLLLGFLLIQAPGFSQTFYKTYGQTGVAEGGQTMTLLPDGNIAVGGFKGDSALLMKVDPAGTIIWSRIFKPQPGFENTLQALAVTPDNYIIGAGNYNNSTIFYSFYFKIDLNGNFQWIRRFNQTQSMYIRRIWAKSATEYVLHGARFDNNTNPFGDIICKVVDAGSGAEIATSPRVNIISAPSYVDDMYSSVVGRGECSYVTGRTWLNGSSSTGMRAYIAKFDASANFLSAKYLMQTAAQSARIYGVDIIYDQDSLVVGYTGDVAGASGNFTVGMVKTDTLGTIAWAKNYQINSSGVEWCYKVLSTSDGYVMTGYDGVAGNNFFILRTDKQGNLLWAKSYGTAANESLKLTTTNNAVLFPNGDICFTGSSGAGTGSDLVIARVDAAGNLSCLTPTNLNVTVANNPTNTTNCTPTTLSNSVGTTTYTGFSTFTLINNCPVLDLGNDTTICSAYTLDATVAGATQYTWSDGSALPTLAVSAPGTYWVNVQAGCCFLTDTIVITSSTVTGNILATPSACSLSYNFQVSSSSSISSWQWDFGAGAGSLLQAPQHDYTAPGTYTVSVVITSFCGSVTLDTVIIVQPSSVSANFTFLPDACSGNVSFTNASMGASGYEWHFGDGITSAAVNPSHVYAAPGPYTVMLIADPNTACADTVSYVVTAAGDVPVAAFSFAQVACSFDISFTNTSLHASDYDWDFDDGTGSATQDPMHTFPGAGTYTVELIASITGNCPDTVTQVVQLDDFNPVAAFTYSAAVCAGTTTFANSSTEAQTWLWDFGDGSPTSTTFSPSHTFSAGTYTVQLIAYNTNCNLSDTIEHTITVHALPVITVNAPAICVGQSATLTAAGATTYTWSTSSTNVSITVSPLITTSYSVSGTDTNGCIGDTVATVTVNQLPLLTVNSPDICTGDPAVLTANSGSVNYSWSSGETVSTITVTPVATSTYTVTATDAAGCSAVAVATVIVHTLPLVTVNSPVICAGQPAILTATGAVSYEWAPGVTAGTLAVSPLADSILVVLGTDAYGCQASATALVTVLPVPVASLIDDTVLCTAQSLVLNVVDGGNPVLWNTGATGNSITVTQDGSYWVTLNNGVCMDRDTVNVQFFVLPDTGNDTTLCEGMSLTLSAGSSSFNYSWSTGSSASSISVTTGGTYWVDVQQGACYARDSVIVKFLAVPVADLGNDTAFCELDFADTLLLDAGTTPSYTYLWNTGDTTQTIEVISPGIYWVLVANAQCTATDTLYVNQFMGIELDADQLLCAQQEILLSPTLFRNAPSSYLWSTGETSPVISVTGPGTYIVQVTQGTCVYTDSAEVKGSISEGALYVPNAFTPGPDYVNDVFYAMGEAIGEFHMQIFDRWGERIFESTRQSEGWDGSYKGKVVPMDTYVWIVDYTTDCSDGTSIRKSGTVSVIR